MRIRSIKPEFWRSPDISSLSVEDRLLFIGLWSYVDDNGVGQDRVSLIAADLFADDLSRDPRDTLARVTEGLRRLSEAGRIIRYTVEERDFLAIDNWKKHQRIDKPNKPRYPAPTSENATIRDTLATPSRHSPETPAPGTEEQRNRGTEEQIRTYAQNEFERVSEPTPASEPTSNPEPPSEEFENWWATYPRKVGKRKAETAWKSALTRTDVETLNAATQQFADHHKQACTESRFIPHATTWLNRDGWNDELPQVPNTTTAPGRLSNAEVARQLQERNAQDQAQQRELSNAEAMQAWLNNNTPKAIGF